VTEAVGTLADEAAKLFAAAESWWRDRAPSAEHAGPECRVCPFCQVLSLVRGAQPDVFDHVAEAAAGLLTALRGAVEEHLPGHHEDVPVERIDIA
jgi:hypothetical protein